MSNIDDLVAQHCPNGVVFEEIQELFVMKSGYTPPKSNKAFWTDGTVPWFRMDDIRKNGRILNGSLQRIAKNAVKGSQLFPANSIIIATVATIGEHALITVPHLSNQQFTSLALKPECAARLNRKFIFYYCFVLAEWCRNNTRKSSFPSVNMDGFKKFRIPVPPLAEQEKIVKILDAFTELEVELEAELEARQQQYIHYRDELLNFDDGEVKCLAMGDVGVSTSGNGPQKNELIAKHCPNGVERTTLGEICTLSRGGIISKNYLRANAGEYPVYSSQTTNNGVFGKIKTYDQNGTFITWTTDGANAGSVFYRDNEKFSITNVCGLISNNSPEKIDLKFLYYVLSVTAKSYVHSGMGNPKLMSNVMSTISVPLPLLEEQKRIVAILDKFDALVNDISSGLPAEITARRQQYEHYRNKLLTFKEAC